MEYPRVTEILRPYTEYSSVPTDILQRAAERGTSVHAICAGLAKGAWIPDGMIKQEYFGYVQSYRRWAEAQCKAFPIVEMRMQDETLGYTGQIDLVAKMHDDELYLVDLKTSARPQKTYPIQMAAYRNLLQGEGIHVKAALLVYLQRDGEFPEIDMHEDLSREFTVFQNALHCWQYFNQRKINARRKKHLPKD